MDPIQPAGSTGGYTPQVRQTTNLNTAAGAASTGNTQSLATGQSATAASSLTSLQSSSTVSMTIVNQQVETMLGNVDQGLLSNENLKLLLAIMIMNALLADDGGTQQTGQGALKALEDFAGGRNNSLYIAIESSTNTVQIEQYSSRLDTVEATQSLSQSNAEQGQLGSGLDTSA